MAKNVKFIDSNEIELHLELIDNKIHIGIFDKSEGFVFRLEKHEVHELIHELMRLKGGG